MKTRALLGYIAILILGSQSPANANNRAAPANDHPLASHTCSEIPIASDNEMSRHDPIQIPSHIRDIVTSGITTLTVAPQSGSSPICVDIQWYATVDNFRTFSERRFVGFAFEGYEAFGYTLIDRRGPPTEIDTGVEPMFSPNGRRFAAAEYSESSFGNLNDIAVWEITDTGTRKIFALPQDSEFLASNSDVRIERWVGDDCVVGSMISSDATERARMPRTEFQLKLADHRWNLMREISGQACRIP